MRMNRRTAGNSAFRPSCDGGAGGLGVQAQPDGSALASQRAATDPGRLELIKSATCDRDDRAGDEIAGDAPYCLLELPWAPGAVIGYVVSRDDVWKAQRALGADRLYLRRELQFIDEATAGESDTARSNLFRAIDRLKAHMGGGWVIGVEQKQECQEHQEHEVQPVLSARAELEAELVSVRARIRAAETYFSRSDVSDAEKAPWRGEWDRLLQRVAAILDELNVPFTAEKSPG